MPWNQTETVAVTGLPALSPAGFGVRKLTEMLMFIRLQGSVYEGQFAGVSVIVVEKVCVSGCQSDQYSMKDGSAHRNTPRATTPRVIRTRRLLVTKSIYALALVLKYSPRTALTASGAVSSLRALRSCSIALSISSETDSIILRIIAIGINRHINILCYLYLLISEHDYRTSPLRDGQGRIRGVDSEPREEGVVKTTAPVFDYRMARGEAIAKVESNIRRIDQNEYRVKSQSGNGEYQVLSTEVGWTCACPDFQFRGLKCKHIFGVELSLQIRRRIENAKRIVPLDYQSCLSCGSERVKRDGVLHNKGGDIQRFECLSCGKRFTNNLGFERMRASPKAITMAMQIYFGGASLRNVQKALKLQGVNVSHVAIFKWIRKYVGLMEEYVKTIDPKVSDTWRADELWVKVKGDMKYLFAVMDDETRFWIAQEVADSKEKHDARRLFEQSYLATGKAPATMITDGLQSYSEAWRSRLAWRRHDVKQTHIREIALAGQVHNNKMERMNGEIRDREKVMRGLKRMDTPILKGMQIYHNFIRPHESLNGATPAERAGIVVEGDDKWRTLIQNAQHQRVNREKISTS